MSYENHIYINNFKQVFLYSNKSQILIKLQIFQRIAQKSTMGKKQLIYEEQDEQFREESDSSGCNLSDSSSNLAYEKPIKIETSREIFSKQEGRSKKQTIKNQVNRQKEPKDPFGKKKSGRYKKNESWSKWKSIELLQAVIKPENREKSFQEIGALIGTSKSGASLRHKYIRIVEALRKKHPSGNTMKQHYLIELWLTHVKNKYALKKQEEIKQRKNSKLMQIIQKQLEWKMYKIKNLTALGKQIEKEIVFLDKCESAVERLQI